MQIKKYYISYLVIFLALLRLIILGSASAESSYKIADIGTLTGGEI